MEIRYHTWRHVRSKSADFAIYRIWVSSIAFWSVFLHCMQRNWCLWISRSHIQLPTFHRRPLFNGFEKLKNTRPHPKDQQDAKQGCEIYPSSRCGLVNRSALLWRHTFEWCQIWPMTSHSAPGLNGIAGTWLLQPESSHKHWHSEQRNHLCHLL